jgi:hypothetical protein
MTAAQLNISVGSQDGKAILQDPVADDWAPVYEVMTRANNLLHSGAKENAQLHRIDQYRKVFEDLNRNRLDITPSQPEGCGPAK